MSASFETEDTTRLLSNARADGFEFGPTLANHLPMVLLALDRLGAPPRRLSAFAESYRAVSALQPPPPPIAPIGWDDWTAHLGERSREADFRAFFVAELHRLGPVALQERALPVLLPGIAASALHALMRLGYAHLAAEPEEIAAGLAYWATTWLALPRGGAMPDTSDLGTILLRLREMPHLLAIRPPTDLLWHAMRAVGDDEAFITALDRLDAREMRPFAAAALALYEEAMDFCSLHALTSMHWLRVVPENVVDRPTALRHLWRALVATYPKMGMPIPPSDDALHAMRTAPCPDWPDIAAAAITSDDEHDISLVFSAREEERHWGEPLYRRVAARRMGLIA